MVKNQIYTIDENQLDNLKRRFLFRGVRVIVLLTLFISVFQFLQAKKGETLIIIGVMIFCILILSISVFRATNKLVKSYKTLQIILNDNGIEAKAEMMPYKSIRWENLMVKIKSKGSINLYDKSISPFMRSMYGKGVIIIQPETLNKEMLVNELVKYQQPHYN
ncbi:hypothetical protein [Mucilaginibacter sp. SG564]|uniref:hypothetical protein n=1 Tax=Mucilaginibacter sp. SG564 TaxID=2587022 RepID=UPI001555A9CC|nr:hypothetical protein [Mucilaginibacter sp. SG564]NOW98881.1 hypothetical protein [Mucilaginibacter sp. SG564]